MIGWAGSFDGRMGFAQDENGRDIADGVIGKCSARPNRGAGGGLLMGRPTRGLAGIDHERAALWHRGPPSGHVLGAHNIGNQYSEGRGVAEDPALAVEWWTRAAERGDAITQLRLGESYEAGRGVTLDLDAAWDWYARSADAGNQDAKAALERLEH